MTVFSVTVSSANAMVDQAQHAPATFTTRWLPPSTKVISAQGDVDAANAADFTDYLLRQTDEGGRVVVDLSGIDFFATAGFSALKTLEARCGVDDVDWVLVPSKAVNRVLRICDPESELRTCYNVTGALSTLNGKTPLLQLVTKSR